jgi:hypothetical protein
MRNVFGVLLLACACVGPASADTGERPSANSSVEDIIRQRIQEWENATRAHDVAKVGRIEAVDWRSVNANGTVSTRQDDLDGLSSGKVAHVRAIFGPIDVKVLGNDIAVSQGTLTEEASAVGDAGPAKAYAYMDVWVRRGGEWVVVRSQAAKLTAPGVARPPA